jgi:hypothetical protein
VLPTTEITCQFCPIVERTAFNPLAFEEHLQSHQIDSCLFATVTAFEEPCHLLLPLSLECPFETCDEQFLNPTEVEFGAHIRIIHNIIDAAFEQRMRAGEFFWWKTGETDSSGMPLFHLFYPSNPSQTLYLWHFTTGTCTSRLYRHSSLPNP